MSDDRSAKLGPTLPVSKNLTLRRVLELRFGLSDGKPRTLEEVGREFGITRERIRQIEEKTFCKLRHPSRARKLRDYLVETNRAGGQRSNGGSSAGAVRLP